MKIAAAIAFAASSVAGVVAQSPIGAFGQCGGDVYAGSTSCIQGYECHFYSEYYSQCLPATDSDSSANLVKASGIESTSAKQTTTSAPATKTTTKKPKTTTAVPTTTKKPKSSTATPTAAPTEDPTAPTDVPTTETPTEVPTKKPTPSSSAPTPAGCTLSGTYVSGTDVSSCSSVVISSLQVPAGVTLDLTKLKDGATVTFTGTTTFGTKLWEGPLILLRGTNLKVTGPGTLNGQGEWYWPQ
ncbi:hypothetical protein AeMF1_018620, partial [Aphanomyces euteiches]